MNTSWKNNCCVKEFIIHIYLFFLKKEEDSTDFKGYIALITCETYAIWGASVIIMLETNMHKNTALFSSPEVIIQRFF